MVTYDQILQSLLSTVRCLNVNSKTPYKVKENVKESEPQVKYFSELPAI